MIGFPALVKRPESALRRSVSWSALAQILQFEIGHSQSPGRAWRGEDTEARSFIVVVATCQPVALALRLRPHAPAMVVCLEVNKYCLRHERIAPGSPSNDLLRNAGSSRILQLQIRFRQGPGRAA
jgi:hypothetical protein